MNKILTRNITSHDLLKTLAVITMIIDHVGYYFYPDIEWFRVVGRLSFPIWAFLIGYANSRDIPARWWIGAGILVISGFMIGQPIFPLNVIPTLIACRLIIEGVMSYATKGTEYLLHMMTLMILLSLPTSMISEYGTLGVLFAMQGYAIRHKQEIDWGMIPMSCLIIGTWVSYAIIEYFIFDFSPMPAGVMAGITFGVCLGLIFFRPAEFTALSKALPGVCVAGVRLMGRRTLEIYVIHLLLFKGLALWLDPDRFQFLHWTWFTQP